MSENMSKAERELLKEICSRCTGEGCSLEQIKDLLSIQDERDPFLQRLIQLGLVRKDEPNSSHKTVTFKATSKGWRFLKTEK
jgi:hypothetical protein